jgi:DNA-binding response OmpR family regulator
VTDHSQTVLVVDDDDDIVETLSLLLDWRGYRTVSASNGQQALEALETDPTIDLVLLDLMMPDVDGVEFRRRQLASPEIAGVPVILLSGGGDAREAAITLHAAGYLVKPVGIDQLLAAVRAVLPPRPSATA